MAPWIFNGEEFTDDDIKDNIAFVYMIECMDDGRYYIGRKNFFMPKYYTIKGKRKKKTVISDYKNYWSSSKVLQELVKELGEDRFKRTIIHLCKSKGESNYMEAKEQFDRQVLLDDNSFNGIINCKIHKSHVNKLKLQNESDIKENPRTRNQSVSDSDT